MIELLKNSVIPCILFDLSNGNVNEIHPLLYDEVDIGYNYDKNMMFYSELRKEGWGVSPKGYAVYTVFTSDYKIVFTGMKVKGVSKISGKIRGFHFTLMTDTLWRNILHLSLNRIIS